MRTRKRSGFGKERGEPSERFGRERAPVTALRQLVSTSFVGSNPGRIELIDFVPITVMGLALSPGAGLKAVASRIAWNLVWIYCTHFQIPVFKESA